MTATVQSRTHEVRRAAGNPGLKFLQRLGYVVRGVLYATMVLALRIALGKPTERSRAAGAKSGAKRTRWNSAALLNHVEIDRPLARCDLASPHQAKRVRVPRVRYKCINLELGGAAGLHHVYE